MRPPRIFISAHLFPALAITTVAAFKIGDSFFASLSTHATMASFAFVAAVLIGAVFAALHHAEVIAAKLGEPLGTLVLTISATIIEVAVVASMMLHGENNPTLAREAVFSVIMIVCTGLVGICLTVGAMRHREQELQPRGTSAFLAVIIALSVLTLVLPNYTFSAPQGLLSTTQLVFVSIVSALLYGAFLFIQTIRHRTDFLDVVAAEPSQVHQPTSRQAIFALIWLIISLVGVVLLSKKAAAGIEEALVGINRTQTDAILGAVIALLVLLPESLSAIRSATRNALQTSLNGALGSALATIGLTVPAVAAVSLITGREIVLGLSMRDTVLLLLTLVLSLVSFGTGRTNVLTGLVHLVVFATYIFLLIVP
jgi:Ca2+:H+ antiporter